MLLWSGYKKKPEYWSNFQKVTEWKRPSEYVKDGKPSLWGSKGVQSNGVRQGMVGDCWYLAAVSALAEKPDRLKKIFKNKEYPDEGIFELTFKVKGIDTSIVIDDRLPNNIYGYK